MDSNRKFQENEDNKPVEQYYGLLPAQIMAEKIQYQIKSYLYRKLSAQEEISDLQRCIMHNSEDYPVISNWRKRIVVLGEEIEFCNRQIKAYRENDNKAKIIPDRCL